MLKVLRMRQQSDDKPRAVSVITAPGARSKAGKSETYEALTGNSRLWAYSTGVRLGAGEQQIGVIAQLTEGGQNL